MNFEKIKEEIELKIKIAEKAKKRFYTEGSNEDSWNNGYICARKEILDNLKNVKGSIGISPDLIMPAKEVHKSSLMAPSAFQIGWQEMIEEEKDKEDKEEDNNE